MDKVTQANAANAEESASASEELNAQAQNLKDAVSELLLLVDGNLAGQTRAQDQSRASARKQVEMAPSPKANGAHRSPGYSAAPRAKHPRAALALGTARLGGQEEAPDDFKEF